MGEKYAASRHDWPTTISRCGSMESPVWVWGDRELAGQIVELLNSGERTRRRLNGKLYRQRRFSGPQQPA